MIQTPMPLVQSTNLDLQSTRSKAHFMSPGRGVSFHIEKGVKFQKETTLGVQRNSSPTLKPLPWVLAMLAQRI